MLIKLQSIIDDLNQDLDTAIVDDFAKKIKYNKNKETNIVDVKGMINTEDAAFQLFLRDFFELYENDYQIDLIHNILDDYYDTQYNLIENIFEVNDEVKQDSISKGLYTEEVNNEKITIKDQILKIANKDAEEWDFYSNFIEDEDQWNSLKDEEKLDYFMSWVDLDELAEELELPIYNSDGHLLLELSDEHVLWRIDNDIDLEEYSDYVQEALNTFEKNNDIEVYTEGRSGRHICIELTAENIFRFNELQEAYKKCEQEFINKLNQVGNSLEEALTTELDDNVLFIDPDLTDVKSLKVLNGTLGQMSDGIWENSSTVAKYWPYIDVHQENGKIIIVIDLSSYSNGFKEKNEDQICKYIANKVKQVCKEYFNDYPQLNGKWDRNDTTVISYLDDEVTTEDAYKVYDALLNRKVRVNESEGYDFGFPNSDELTKTFKEMGVLPDEVLIDDRSYTIEQYYSKGNYECVIYTDVDNDDSYFKVYYTLNKVGEDQYEGIKDILGVTDFREEIEEIEEPLKVKSSHIEDLGGHTMAVFGQFENNDYFVGNEESIAITDQDYWEHFLEDQESSTEDTWLTDHTIKTIQNIDNAADINEASEYLDIMKQVKFYTSTELEDLQNQFNNLFIEEDNEEDFLTESNNKYKELKDKQAKEIEEFPFMFAFDDKQFEEGMAKLGLNKEDTDQILTLGAGIYMKKADVDKYKELTSKHRQELNDAIENDKTGEGFIKDMFVYELNNHEYSYTNDIEDTIDALGLTEKDLSKENIKKALQMAQDYLDNPSKKENLQESKNYQQNYWLAEYSSKENIKNWFKNYLTYLPEEKLENISLEDTKREFLNNELKEIKELFKNTKKADMAYNIVKEEINKISQEEFESMKNKEDK